MYRPYRQEAISCSHVQPHIFLFLITGNTILIDFLLSYSVSYRSSSFFESNFLRLISYFFKNLRLINFLQSKGVSYEWAGTVKHNTTFITMKVYQKHRQKHTLNLDTTQLC